jgi:hypothetical protein
VGEDLQRRRRRALRPPPGRAAGLDSPDLIEVGALSGSAEARRTSTYAELAPDEYGLMLDPRGWVSIVRGNPGNAAEGLSLQSWDLVWLSAG